MVGHESGTSRAKKVAYKVAYVSKIAPKNELCFQGSIFNTSLDLVQTSFLSDQEIYLVARKQSFQNH